MLLRLSSRVFVSGGLRFYCKAAEPRNWDVVGAVCLERRPVITKELTKLEKQMLEYLRQVELERSLKSNFEVQETRETSDSVKSSGDPMKKDVKSVLSSRDTLDIWEKELKGVTLATPLTEADKIEDIKSVKRKLSDRLFLLIKQEDTGNRWLFPQGGWTEGETLRETAERILQKHCGPELKARFISNAPCGFFQYKYPKSYIQKGGVNIGAKVFFYKAELIGGQVKNDNYQWRTKKELLSAVDKKYAKTLDGFLFNDS